MRKGLRKTYHKKMMKLIRDWNRETAEDPMWNGRFYMELAGEEFETFSDGSGGTLFAHIRMYDKKMGFWHDYWYEYAPYLCGIAWNLYMGIANTFVVDHSSAWRDPNGGWNDPTDYRDWPLPKADCDNFYERDMGVYDVLD